jgi:monoamine oxidase
MKKYIFVLTFFVVALFAGENSLKAAQSQIGKPSAKSADVIIVGAGLAGLSTAFRLKKAGKSFILLESTAHIGGRIRTAAYKEGVGAELGLEEFWEGNPTLEIFKELKVPLESSASSFSSFYFQGKLYPFLQENNVEFVKAVMNPEELKAYQNWDKVVSEIYEKISKKNLDAKVMALKDISFADWVRKKFKLPNKVQEFIRIESEPEFATSWERISALDGIAEWHIFSGPGTGSFHIVGGNHLGALAIADAIGRENILLNHQVTSIHSSAEYAEVTATTADFKEVTFRSQYAVTTPPLFRLHEIQFDPALSKERLEAIQTQTWGAYFSAHVIVDSAAEKFWKLKTEDCLPILTDSPLGVIYGANSSTTEAKVTVLNLLISGDSAEAFNMRTMGLDSVRQILLKNLEKLWPGFSPNIKKILLHRYHPRAIASWPVGRSRYDKLSDEIRKPQGRIYFGGDFTENTHSDGAALSAIRIADEITKKLSLKK